MPTFIALTMATSTFMVVQLDLSAISDTADFTLNGLAGFSVGNGTPVRATGSGDADEGETEGAEVEDASGDV